MLSVAFCVLNVASLADPLGKVDVSSIIILKVSQSSELYCGVQGQGQVH